MTDLTINSNGSGKVLVGYFASWSPGAELQLANVAAYVNMVIVSFMKPNAAYTKGSYELGKKDELTGLEFNVEGELIKNAIALLKQKNPNTKVLISIGGDTYSAFGYFENLNSQAIADVVEDFGFDGVDICFEPYRQAQCSTDAQGHIRCTTDELFRTTVSKVRQVLPRPYLLTLSAWSIGAYGEGQWVNSKPRLGLTGLNLGLLRSSEAQLIDQLNVMSYSAGSEYDPKETLAAYQHYFRGKITMGVHVPPEPWAPDGVEKYVYTIPKVRELTQAVQNQNAAGMMLWYLQATQDAPSDENPNPEMMAKAICQLLLLGDCNQPLFSS